VNSWVRREDVSTRTRLSRLEWVERSGPPFFVGGRLNILVNLKINFSEGMSQLAGLAGWRAVRTSSNRRSARDRSQAMGLGTNRASFFLEADVSAVQTVGTATDFN
jgi:hypothetical protein